MTKKKKSINVVQKGKTGENEICDWLYKNLNIKAERIYNQAKGGADIVISDFIIEVKRRQTFDFKSWWYQVSIAKKRHEDKNLIPVVAFRQNYKKWEFLIPAPLIHGLERGYIRCEEDIFLNFAKTIVGDVNG